MISQTTQITDEITAQLLDPENSILKQFKETASGTFFHCENVSRLCEKLGHALKLNINILRILGMYHDIGKMISPEYFCENQPKDFNVHDTLPPYISYKLISSHIADSVAIIVTKIPEIPIDLIKCMSMHHGNSILKSIYNKLKSTEKTSEDDYRYKYSKPDDVYACILMIVDSVDATVKAMINNNKITEENTIEKIINSIIDELSITEQIDELTIRQERIIRKILCTELSGINQNRIIDGYESKK